MKIILEQIILLFTFMVCGYILGKKGLIKAEHTKILSTLEIYMFLPCTIFKSFYNSFTVSNLSNYYPLMLVAVVLLIVLYVISIFISKLLTKNKYRQTVFGYSLTVSNYGYMGYALAEGIFGSEGLLLLILFALPFSLYVYTAGYASLTKQKISFKQLANPIIISMVIGAFFGITQLNLPSVAETIITKSSACMAPISMVLAGLTISEFKAKELITDKKVYITSVLRLLVIPFAVLLILKPFLSDEIVRTAVLYCAMPCGLNTIVFPKLIGGDCKTGAKLAFISNILAIATIPLVLNFI